MSDDINALFERLSKMSPEERAKLLALLEISKPAEPVSQIGDVVGQDKVGGDKVGGDKINAEGSQGATIAAGRDARAGSATVGDSARVIGPVVGLNLGTIIYGRRPEDDERERLVWYLERLSAKLYRLPLRGIEERLDQGDGVAMPKIYVELATTKWIQVMPPVRASTLVDYFGNLELPIDEELRINHKHSQLWALPSNVVIVNDVVAGNIYSISIDELKFEPQEIHYHEQMYNDIIGDLVIGNLIDGDKFSFADETYKRTNNRVSDKIRVLGDRIPGDKISGDKRLFTSELEEEYMNKYYKVILNAQGDLLVNLLRPWLVTEAVMRHKRLILLGVPGSGKSTLVRHLSWILAEHALRKIYITTFLPGWNDNRELLPIILSLRALAGDLARHGVSATTVTVALEKVMADYDVLKVDDLLRGALNRGAAILFFDGLDEVPLDEVPGVSVGRQATLQAINEFARLYPKPQMIVTCRVRAFEGEMKDVLGWQVETLAPLMLGQVRHFIPAWYGEMAAKGQIDRQQQQRLEQTLIDTIVASQKLREMAATPLLLTMMALVLYNKGELPRDRPKLYERVLELLLGQWDKVRDGQSLTQAIGLPDDWDSSRILPVLDEVSYRAHQQVSSQDGRGRITHRDLLMALIDFFKQARVRSPGDAAYRCLDYFEQRSGLLTPDDDDTFVFAHLTLQEHCAGRYIAKGTNDPTALVLQHRADDRWREPIMLGVGLMQPAELNSVLMNLIDIDEDGTSKETVRWYRDLILAAEIGKDRHWDYLRTSRMIQANRLERDLRTGLSKLLNDQSQPLPITERMRAASLLGDLGDPRYPVTTEEWLQELKRAFQGDNSGYFCVVPSGRYIVGGKAKETDTNERDSSVRVVMFEKTFLIARYPITNEQWKIWTDISGVTNKFAGKPTSNHPNHPAVGMGLDKCVGFCDWLSAELSVTVQYPTGEIWKAGVRVPTEDEWEAAARGTDFRVYPWGQTWKNDCAATAQDQWVREARQSAPVGCYPAGASPWGAMDMAGNVAEWVTSSWASYADENKNLYESDRRILCGGSFNSNEEDVRCAARRTDVVEESSLTDCGFRVVVVLDALQAEMQ